MEPRFSEIFLMFTLATILGSGKLYAQTESFTVVLDEVYNGKIELAPALPADGKYPAGTVVTVTATPDAGYVLDSGYYSVPGRFGAMYHETMTPRFEVVIDQEKHIGASFIKGSEVDHIDVTHDVVFAKPGVKTLKYDVFSPKGASNLPCIIIIHGGGWAANNEDIMRGLARELTRGGQFVVFSIDYRWTRQLDGDATIRWPTSSRMSSGALPILWSTLRNMAAILPELG